jgi:hypothetical protein
MKYPLSNLLTQKKAQVSRVTHETVFPTTQLDVNTIEQLEYNSISTTKASIGQSI